MAMDFSVNNKKDEIWQENNNKKIDNSYMELLEWYMFEPLRKQENINE